MNEFLIQKETLTNIADKFRDYLYEVGDNTHMIDPQFRPTYEDELAEGAVNFTFYEEFDAAGYPADQGTYSDGSKDGGFLMCGMRRNDKGHLVPVIISGGMVDNQEEDYSAYYYVGIDVVEGVTYDKWRRIEGVDISTGGPPDPDENYMWESPFRSYLYTNRIVIPVSENITQYNPTDFDTKIDDVYTAGAASGSGGSGGSVETCTVILSTDGSISSGFQYCFSAYVDETIVATYAASAGRSVTLLNVVCGSAIMIETNTVAIEPAGSVANGGKYLGNGLYTYYFEAPSDWGVTATFSFYDND